MKSLLRQTPHRRAGQTLKAFFYILKMMNIMVKKYIVLLSYLKLDFCAHEVGGLNYPYRPDRREGPALYLGG